jgi:E3 ubiquitin-protein ligase UBR1
VSHTISAVKVAQRGVGVDSSAGGTMMVDALSELQTRMIGDLAYGDLAYLTRLVALQFKNRSDEGRDAVRQAIIKRLLPDHASTHFRSLSWWRRQSFHLRY